MLNGFNFDELIDALAERVAERVSERLRLAQSGDASPAVKPRLLTLEQAASYISRTKMAVQHMIADGALPIVRHDRRVFLDIRDLDAWIERGKG